MYKKSLVLIAAFALIAVLFSGCGNIAGNNVRINENDITPFNAVSVTTSFSKIELIASDRYGLEIFVPDRFAPEWDIRDGRLAIREKTNSFVLNWTLFSPNYYVKVYYPAGTDFTDITLLSASGRIEIPEEAVSDLNIKSASGSIKAGAENADHVSIESSSGNITFAGSGGDVRLESQSGTVNAETLNSGSIRITTSSGRVVLTDKGDIATTLTIDTQSGRIEARGGVWQDLTARSSSGSTTISGELLGSTYVETASGSVQINVSGSPSEYGYTLTPASGSIHWNGERMGKPAFSSGSFDNHISVSTASGGIRVDFSKN